MSLDTTTLASACAIDDVKIVVASAAGIAIGDVGRVDEELFTVTKGYVVGSTTVPIVRAQQGTTAQAHPSGATVVTGQASEWAQSDAPQTVVSYPIAGRAREILSYSADGAITLPTAGNDMVAVINGTARAMTVAEPGRDLDGSLLFVVGVQAAAHTVTAVTASGGASSFGNAGSDNNVATFGTGGICCMLLIASGGFWVPLPSLLAGSNIADMTVTLA